MSATVRSLETWLPVLIADTSGAGNDAIYNFIAAPRDIQSIKDIIAQIEAERAVKVKTAQERGAKAAKIGALFERLLKVTFDGCLAFKYEHNIRNITSELDCVFTVQPLGLVVPMLKFAGTVFLGEARCRGAEPPSSEWVNEVSGSMGNHKVSLSFLIVDCSSRTIEHRARVAIALAVNSGRVIVPFGRKQFADIIAGKNVLRVMVDQFVRAQLVTNDLEV